MGSLPTITIPAGGQGEISVCAVPTNVLPAPGTMDSFSVSATSTTDPAITSTGSGSFTVPQLQGATLSVNPATLATTAGTAVTVPLEITGTGNAATPVTLSISSDSNLTVNNPQGSLTINPGATSTDNITVTPGPSAPIGIPLTLTITGSFGSGQTSVVAISVTVLAAQALPARQAAIAAAAAGRTDVATTLGGLTSAVTGLVASCTPTSLLSVQNYTQNLLQQVTNSSYLTGALQNLGYNAFGDIASATCANYSQPLTELVQVITNLNNYFNAPGAYRFQIRFGAHFCRGTAQQHGHIQTLLLQNQSRW